jgi:hypothetical protein
MTSHWQLYKTVSMGKPWDCPHCGTRHQKEPYPELQIWLDNDHWGSWGWYPVLRCLKCPPGGLKKGVD